MSSNLGILLGEHVWVGPKSKGEFDVAIGAVVKLSDSGKIALVDDEGNEHWVNASDAGTLKRMHPSSVEGVEDMIQLGDLHEAGMLHNVYIRYYNHMIYTFTGSILVAVNPYQLYPIYDVEHVLMYQNKKIGELPPHIFAIADNAYHIMVREHRNQCILVSGESGAGKTESTKLILQFLAAISGQHSWIEQQILEANPIMEAFGNAKTVRNDNSSRFGKYIDVHFNQNGIIEGAKIDQYLLEKSRIVNQMDAERNYHIFYRMLCGMKPEEKKALKLTCAEDYYYLTQGGCTTCPGMDDAEEFAIIRGAMKVLLFSDDNIWQIFKLLAAILHLGNLELIPAMSSNLDATIIEDQELLTTISDLLEVPYSKLVDALTTKSTLARGELIYSPISVEKSINVRDAFVKGVYGRIFISIVEKINTAIYAPERGHWTSIGVLDIFGFENFGKNSFEQLCINYANENLQQFFVRHIFKLEQNHYDQEGIKWQHITFVDNQDILDMLGQKPMNIISLIDEESRFPKGTDQTMLNKLVNNHGKTRNSHFIAPVRQTDTKFGINHFAGSVMYESGGFLDKNRDTFSADLIDLISNSKSKFLYELFSKVKSMGEETRKRSPSLGAQFKKSLDALMKTLQACHPFFVRCIKPNEFKKPLIQRLKVEAALRENRNQEHSCFTRFDRELCCRQLRYSGMMETIRIRRLGYPIRHTYNEFVDRYYLLVKGMKAKMSNPMEATGVIANLILPSEDWQLGKTKIFLKDAHDVKLETYRDTVMSKQIVIIQKVFRGYFYRKRYLLLRQSTVILQRAWRANRDRLRFVRLRRGIALIQAVFKAQRLSHQFMILRDRLVVLQAFCRGFVTRVRVRQRSQAVIKLQSGWRRVLAKKRVEVVRRERHKKLEAERIAIEEEMRLTAQMGRGAAKREAERRLQERLRAIEKTESELRIQRTIEAKRKTEEVRLLEESAKRRREEDVDDSAMIDNMFGYLEDNDNTRRAPPSHFKDLDIKEEPMIASDHVKLSVNDQEDEDLSQFDFSKFAATYFIGATHSHCKQNIRQPLLPLSSEADTMAALAVWITILRFMGDMAEPKDLKYTQEPSGPVMAKIYDTFGRKFGSHKGAPPAEFEDANYPKRETLRKKLVSLTLKRKSKITQDVTTMLKEGAERGYLPQSYGPLSAHDKPTTNLEKLHFIIGHGILRPELRDEIYCQICKQLTENPNKTSHARGWILLSLCVGCFSPTEKLYKYLLNFIRQGPPGYAPYCGERLSRTKQNGARHQPPSWLELRATKSKKSLILPITFMDGNTKTIFTDSATTSRELCIQLSEKVGITDTFGFSIYVALFDKVSSLGSGNDHVMDAISQCEQYAKEMGQHERDAPWRLFFRKEIFSPWHDPREDWVSTGLIYQQIIRGIKFGEYRFSSEEELAEIAALQYYVEYGKDMSRGRLMDLLAMYIPDPFLESSRAPEKWVHLIEGSFKHNKFIREDANPQNVKEHVVHMARMRWPLLFSRFYEAFQFAGPSLGRQDVIIAVNWTGVYVVDDREHVLLELQFPEITGIASSSSIDKSGSLSFTLSTLRGDDYTFTSPTSEDIRDLVTFFLDGLRARSKHVVAIMDYDSPGENTNFLSFKKNDLIILQGNETGESISSSGWCNGLSDRTGLSGDFPAECVYILPSLGKPAPDILAQFEMQSKEGAEKIIASAHSALHLDEVEIPEKPHTLESYARDHFVPPAARTIGRSGIRKEKHVVWSFQKEPIKLPLLQRLVGKEDLSYKSTQTFLAILKYMGDYPSKRSRTTTELTDEIFEPPLNSEPMRDEVYCQLIKQLTGNKIKSSEEHGWELMWLCTGLFACSNQLLKDVSLFLQSWRRTQPLAKECILRLQKTMRVGQRKYPPHMVEVGAIQHGTTQVFHKVYFPDETHKAIEIDSGTKAKDLCTSIAQRLDLKYSEGFSLFVKLADKVISVPEGDFFFDFVRHLMEWLKKTRANSTSYKSEVNSTISYSVFFMKKLWSNTIPGKDPAADCKFHYHQELPKYLRCYHKCTVEDAYQLGALIYRVKFGDDKTRFPEILRILRELVPYDMHNRLSTDDWKRGIVTAFNRHAGKTQNDAKVSFLKIIYRWPTFGSAFFEVKQTTEPHFPEQLIIAINKNGVSLIKRETKEILETYPFTKISNWSSGNTYYHMTIGNLMKGSKFLCETSLGYKMDDLLTSYISMMLTNINKGKRGTLHGEYL